MMTITRHKILLFLLPLLIFLPIFFQLNHGLFDSTEMHFNSGGALLDLPIPISAFICFLGILFLGKYQPSNISLTFIFFSFILMFASVIATTGNDLAAELAKFILMIQFLLPMFAMTLGQMYVAQIKSLKFRTDFFLHRPLFYLLMTLVPLQLVMTWLHGSPCLISSLGIFSIYQHLQYVPMIFVGAYLIVIFTAWNNDGLSRLPKWLLAFLTLVVCIYAIASMSMAALATFTLGVLMFSSYQIRRHKDKSVVLLIVSSLLIGGVYAGYAKQYFTNIDCGFSSKVSAVNNSQRIQERPFQEQTAIDKTDIESSEKNITIKENISNTLIWYIPANILERLTYWSFYIDQLIQQPSALLAGVKEAPDRSLYPSAHNYYLDFIYNFGFVALLPLLILIGITFNLILRNHRSVYCSPYLLSICMVILFYIVFDNMLKVSMRQPYSGIVTFFLWGILVSELNLLRGNKKP